MVLRRFCDRWNASWFRRLIVVGMAGACIAIAAVGVERVLYGSSEFMGFRRIVQVSLVQGLDHYEHIPHIRAYPPSFAIFWAPFGLLPLRLPQEAEEGPVGASASQQVQLAISAVAVLMLMAALTVWAARCVMDACYPAGEGRSGWPVAALLWVLSSGLMLNSVVRCETDAFILMMVAGAMRLLLVRRRGWREWQGGALLGLAAALKLTPGLFGVYLVCRRRWRALGGMIAGGLLASAVLPVLVWGGNGAFERSRSWLERVIVPYAKQGPEAFIPHAYRLTNQSPKAALVRYLTRYNAGSTGRPSYVNVADLAPSAVARLALALKVAILAALLAAWLVPSRRCTDETEALLFALVPLGMLLISDLSLGGHLAILAVPLGALIGFCFRREGSVVGETVSWVMLGGCLLCYLIAWPLLKELSVGTAGVLLLFGLVAYVARRAYVDGRAGRAVQAA